MDAPFELHFLGPPRVTRAGAEVSISSAKAVALLGYLAAGREPVPRERVLGLLWPDSSQDAARKNLRNTLWSLGRALGEDALLARDDRLALSPEAWVDLRMLEDGTADRRCGSLSSDALTTLADLYRGPFLDGLVLPDAAELELWLGAERERLAARYLRVLSALVEDRRRAQDWPGVAAAAGRGLAVDRLHEPLHRALVEALVRAGQRAEAQRRHATFRQALRAELDVDPLPETEAFVAALFRGEELPIAPGVDAVAAPVTPAPGPSAASPFVGRAAERARLDEALRLATQSARVVLVTGEVGIGKSRLWQEWSAGLPPGALVLATRGLENTRTLPLVPVVDLLARAAPLRRLLGPSSPLEPVWLADLARLFPELRHLRPGLATAADMPPEEERRRLFEALTQVLRAVGGAPPVLFVDDAHWVDDATLDWLGYLVNRLRDEPLLVVVAARPEALPDALRRLMAGWEREGIASRLPLRGLDEREAGELMAALGTDAAAAPRLQAQARGNPLFLTELARAGDEAVPSMLAEVIRARLDRLPDAAQQVLQAAAVLEPDADFATLRQTAGRGEDETLDALDELVAAAVLTEGTSAGADAGAYAFTHPLEGEVVRGGLGAARRSVLHRRAAEALKSAHASDPAIVAGRVAEHYAAAGLPGPAATYAALAAERALDLAAPSEAVAWYERAVALDPSPARQLDLANARVRLGDAAGARAAFEAARSDFAALGDRRRAAEACLGLAGTYLGTGLVEPVVTWTEQALAYLEGLDDPADEALAQVLLGASGQDLGAGSADAEAHLLAAARLARENDLPRVLASSQFELGNLRARQGRLAEARTAYRDVIGLARAAGDRLLEALGHNNAAYHALVAGDLPDARTHLAAGMALAEADDLAMVRQWLYSVAGELALADADWDAAEGWFRRALAEAERYGNPEQVANCRAHLGQVERGRGHLRAAALLLGAAAHAAARLQSPYLQTDIDLQLAEVELARGEIDAAGGVLRRATRRLDEQPYPALQTRAADLRARLDHIPGYAASSTP